jgi:hypothetical protein
VGWWLWHKAESGLAKVEGELQLAVSNDLSTSVLYPRTSAVSQEQVIVEQIISATRERRGEEVVNVHVRDLGEDWAVINVLLRLTSSGPIYQQTRVYHNNGRSWMRTEITPALWGQSRLLETKHFAFHYHSLDHEAVTEAAARIDAIYLTFYSTYFATQPDDEKVVVVVKSEWTPGLRIRQSQLSEPLVIGSPATALAPVELSAADMILQALVLELLNRLSTKAAAFYQVPDHWQTLQRGLALWLMWDQALPLTTWHQPVVRWIFRQPLRKYAPEAISFSEFGHALCADHSLWILSPLEIGIPLTCLRLPHLEPERQIQGWPLPQELLRELILPPIQWLPPNISHDTTLSSVVSVAHHPSATVLLSTVIEYVAQTYGSARVPILLAALSEHTTWHTLIPAVFHVSVEEFEKGWRDFLSDQYSIVQ